MPKHTTAGEDAVYASSDSDVQDIIDRLDKMIDERDDKIADLKDSLSELRSEKDDEIAGLKEELRNQ